MLEVNKNNGRYEIAGIVDPGFIKKGKPKTGLSGFDGCLGSIIGFLLEKIFHKTVSLKIDKKMYYFYSSSVVNMVNRVYPQANLAISDITKHSLPHILDEVKKEVAKNLHEKAKQQREELRQAILGNDFDQCKVLLEKGVSAKTDAQAIQESLLCVAIRGSNIPLCQLLLEHGADVNERDYIDMTPIEQAVTRCDKELVKWLIDQGADTTIETSLNKTKTHKGATLLEFIDEKLFWVDSNPTLLAHKNAIIELLKGN